jgi:hypothetical protein
MAPSRTRTSRSGPPGEIDVTPPGNAYGADVQTSGLFPLYWTTQGSVQHAIIDPQTGGLAATYGANESGDAALYGVLQNTVTQVIDTTAGAPAVGTLWDTSEFDIPIIIGTDAFVLPVLLNDYESDPTGTTQDGFQIDLFTQLGNYFSTGAAGTLDELTIQGFGPFSFALPLFDIPATASTGAATDGGSLLSDLATMF